MTSPRWKRDLSDADLQFLRDNPGFHVLDTDCELKETRPKALTRRELEELADQNDPWDLPEDCSFCRRLQEAAIYTNLLEM